MSRGFCKKCKNPRGIAAGRNIPNKRLFVNSWGKKTASHMHRVPKDSKTADMDFIPYRLFFICATAFGGE